MESEKLTVQLKESSTEVESLRSVRDSLKLEESKTSALQIDCEVCIPDMQLMPCRYDAVLYTCRPRGRKP